MMVVFGAEPEPAITRERQELVWRFRGLDSQDPVADLEELEAVVVHDGAEYGPFRVFGSRREPGTYRTTHIFSAAAGYSVRLTFRKAGETERHSVAFDFRIGDREQMTIPREGAPPASQEANEIVEAFHAALAAGDGEHALSYLAPDVIIFESGGAEMSRDEYASHHLGGDMRFAAGTQRDTLDQHHESFDDTAYVLTRSRTTGSFGDREIDSTGVESMVLRRIDGQWRIIHIHWSSRRSPQQ